MRNSRVAATKRLQIRPVAIFGTFASHLRRPAEHAPLPCYSPIRQSTPVMFAVAWVGADTGPSGRNTGPIETLPSEGS
jgi:hypothetical protein